MSDLSISEGGSVQFPMVAHAAEIGWVPLAPEDAKEKRGGEDAMLFRDDLRAKLREFNPWLTEDAIRQVVETLDALRPTIEGNHDMLSWLRGERSWYDEAERRHRRVKLIDFENADANVFHVTWEWKVKPPGRKGNRADVMFVVNGIPVCIVEHKNPRIGDAIDRAVVQLRRYEIETPELIAAPQLFNVTHLLDYWYGVTWNATRRAMARWKETPDEAYRLAVQSFFERIDFLRTLEQWILFYVEDNELRKSVLRQHQRRAIDRIIERCADANKRRGLIWHTQGSGKTFTLLTAGKLLLEDKERFRNATVIVVVDRTELEGQLSGWVDRLLGEMQQLDIPTERADSKAHLQRLLDRDFRGLIVSMIHKFEEIRKSSSDLDNIFVLIDEAHRSVARELGSYLMAALPNATIIGFTGTPIAKTAQGDGTFKIFGAEDERGYLDKYSILESIEDETTVPIKHTLAPSEMTVPSERLDKEFFALASSEGITDVEELNRVLEKAVSLRTFLKADDRVANVAKFVAEHFQQNVAPLGLKAFLVAVDREACAKYKQALDELLPPEWVVPVYTGMPADVVERPLVASYQLSDQQEGDVRRLFKKPDELPKLLIVTDKLLTGYDAPLLFCMYLDKPMRNHVLLQAIARVNRPYEDEEGKRKQVGLVIDFVGVLRELKKALQFDSSDVSGVIEGLDVLMADFLTKIVSAREGYLNVEGGSEDERLERIVYGRFRGADERKRFFEAYKELENLYEILSPSAELRDHIATFKRLAKLYAAVRNAYSTQLGFTTDLAYKTRRLIEENAEHEGLSRFSKSVTFDVATLEGLQRDTGPDEGKVFNLVRGIQKQAEEHPEQAAVLRSLKDRAERVLKSMMDGLTSAHDAMVELERLAVEKEAAEREARASGLSPRAFGVYWVLRDDSSLVNANIDAMAFAREVQTLIERYPDASVNADERRLLLTGLYRPLLALSPVDLKRIVERTISALSLE
ncbi:MAG: type I restriction endonuclease subunit R [Vulcanimicrobiaceae bacterium]